MSEDVALNLKLFNIPINAVASSGHQHLGSSFYKTYLSITDSKAPENMGVYAI